MKKLIAVAIALMTLMSLMIPVFATADVTLSQPTMWVNCADGYRLNVRNAPNTTDSKVMFRLDCGTRVEIVDLVGVPSGWAFITSAKHPEGGFVMTSFLQAKQPGKYEITERSDHFRPVTPYTVAAKPLNSRTVESVGLRVIPNKTSAMLRRLVAGDRLQVISVGEVWSQVVDLKTGLTGYVANDYMVRL